MPFSDTHGRRWKCIPVSVEILAALFKTRQNPFAVQTICNGMPDDATIVGVDMEMKYAKREGDENAREYPKNVLLYVESPSFHPCGYKDEIPILSPLFTVVKGAVPMPPAPGDPIIAT